MNKEDVTNLIYNIEHDFNCVDTKLIDILNKYKNFKLIQESKPTDFNRLSSLIDKKRFTPNPSWIKKYNNLINTLNDLRNAPSFMDLDLDICRPFFKLIYDKYDAPVIFVTKRDTNELGEFFSFKIYGLYGEGTRTKDMNNKINYIELNGLNRTIFNMLDISTIEVNRYFRQGRGTSIIKYLENEVIDGFNNSPQYKNKPIMRIEGTIGTLGGYYMSNEDKIRFYIKNGFTVVERRFYKNINNVGFFDNII